MIEEFTDMCKINLREQFGQKYNKGQYVSLILDNDVYGFHLAILKGGNIPEWQIVFEWESPRVVLIENRGKNRIVEVFWGGGDQISEDIRKIILFYCSSVGVTQCLYFKMYE